MTQEAVISFEGMTMSPQEFFEAITVLMATNEIAKFQTKSIILERRLAVAAQEANVCVIPDNGAKPEEEKASV